jgi:hypothetical protein
MTVVAATEAAAMLCGFSNDCVLIRCIFVVRRARLDGTAAAAEDAIGRHGGGRGWMAWRRPRRTRLDGTAAAYKSPQAESSRGFHGCIVSLSRFLSNCLPFPYLSVSYLIEFDRLEVVATLSRLII